VLIVTLAYGGGPADAPEFSILRVFRLECSISRIADRTGQFFQPAAGEDFLKFVEKRVMHQAIRRQRLAACDLEFTAGKVSDLPAGLFDYQHSRGRIPGVEIKFPEAVEPSRRYIAQI
jgi:hypothetical protein